MNGSPAYKYHAAPLADPLDPVVVVVVVGNAACSRVGAGRELSSLRAMHQLPAPWLWPALGG